MTFADCRLQAAILKTADFLLISHSVPFPLPRTNRKQANPSAIQANLTDIHVNQSGIRPKYSLESENVIHHFSGTFNRYGHGFYLYFF